MKKGLAFILALSLVLGSFGFAFAGNASNGIDTIDKIKSASSIQVNYKGESSLAVEMSDVDFVVIKQGSDFVLVWLAEDIDNEADRQVFYSSLQAADPSLKVDYKDVIFISNNVWESSSASNVGAYYFRVPGSELLDGNGETTLEGKFAVASGGKVSHFLIGTFCEEPTYAACFTINKEVKVKSGSPATEDFTFNVEVSGSAIVVDEQTITIPAGSTEGSISVSIPDLTEDDFPFDLIISEKNGEDNDWTYDATPKVIKVGLDNGQVAYYNGNDNSANVTFINEFSGSYELNIPIKKDSKGDLGFPDETFTFTAATTPGGGVVGTSNLTLSKDKAEDGVINVYMPEGTKAGDFPITLMVAETAGNNPSWDYDETCYAVLIKLVKGVPTIAGIKKMPTDHSMTATEYNDDIDSIIFTNTYTTPLTFEVPFTKNVDGEKYGGENFHFTAELIPNVTEEAVAMDSETLEFSGDMTASAGKFEFKLNSTQAAAWLPAQIKISETTGTSAGWDYDQHLFWAQVDKHGVVSSQFVTDQSTTSSIAFTNKYHGEPIDLQIPIKKIGTVDKGAFGSQVFNFDVSMQNGEEWETLSGASITLTYPNTMNGTTVLKFSENQLEEYAKNYGDPILLKITEKNGKANYWTYDNKEYMVQIDNYNGNWEWSIGEAKEIVFNNSFNYSGGTGTKDDSKKPTYYIEDNEVPITYDPSDIDMISIPEAEIPLTGGIGIAIFLAIGGATTALGAGMRKKDKR